MAEQLDLRSNEFRKATENYLGSLRRELAVFERNNQKFDKRNDDFKKDVENVMTRYRIGCDNVRKSQERLTTEKDKINQYIIKNFNVIASKVKNTLNDEKLKIEGFIDDEYEKHGKNEPKASTMTKDKITYKEKRFVTNYHDMYNNINRVLKETEDERKNEFVIFVKS